MPQPSKDESLIIEARARIIWGDSPAAVETWLQEQKLDQTLIDDVIRVSTRERSLEVRKRGISEIFIGIGIGLAGGAVIGAMFLIGIFHLRGLGLAGVVVAYGVYRLLRGLMWLGQGGTMQGSVTDMNDQL